MKRVLIVDDAIDVCRMLQDAIKTTHPEIAVSVVPSAEEALLESTRLNVDLLVADIRLPGMSGLELVRKIRVRQPQVKVIIMTGLKLDDRLKKQKEDIAPDAFLPKPIAATLFLETVEGLIGSGVSPEAPKQTEPLSRQPRTDQHRDEGSKPVDQSSVLQELAAVMPGEPAEAKPKAPIKRLGTGSLAQPPEPAETDKGLSSILSRLRGSLTALSVMLLDESGHPVAQAGDLPDPALEGQLVPPVMSAISSGAKISYLLGQSAVQSVQAYRGIAYSLVLAPVGQYVLLMLLKNSGSQLRLALAFEEALNAQAELSGALEAMGVHIQSTMEMGAPETLLAELGSAESLDAVETEAVLPEILETPLGQDPGLEKFEEQFTRKKTGQLRMEDPDSFWESASEEGQEISQSGVLSFEQALKLGLLPPDQQ